MIFTLGPRDCRIGTLTAGAVKGSMEAMIWWSCPAATHSDVDGQEIPNMPLKEPVSVPSGRIGPAMTLTKDHAPGPPVGSAEVMTSALLSTAAQAEGEGQETPVTGKPVPATTDFQLAWPPVGSVEVIIWPGFPVTQRPVDGHEMPFG